MGIAALSPDQIPTVFVTLTLEPNQFDLFSEIEAEAIEVFGGQSVTRSSFVSGGSETVLLDYESLRLALSWYSSTADDRLTFAIGALPDREVRSEDARSGADILRQLAILAEALFAASLPLWQIASLPLNADTIERHAAQLTHLGPRKSITPFFSFVPHRIHEEKTVKCAQAKGEFLTDIFAAADAENSEPSWALQASALTLSSVCTLVTPPVGVAMFTYAVLRQGTDMDLFPRKLDVPKLTPTSSQRLSHINNRGLQVSVVSDFV